MKELGNGNSDDEDPCGYVKVSTGLKIPEKVYDKLYPYHLDTTSRTFQNQVLEVVSRTERRDSGGGHGIRKNNPGHCLPLRDVRSVVDVFISDSKVNTSTMH